MPHIPFDHDEEFDPEPGAFGWRAWACAGGVIIGLVTTILFAVGIL